jgi:hypothetical protein
MAFRNAAKGGEEIQNRVLCQAVEDELAFTSGRDQAGAAQVLEMLRCVRQRHAGSVRQHFDTAVTLGELFEKFQAKGMSGRLRDQSKLGEQHLLWTFA